MSGESCKGKPVAPATCDMYFDSNTSIHSYKVHLISYSYGELIRGASIKVHYS